MGVLLAILGAVPGVFGFLESREARKRAESAGFEPAPAWPAWAALGASVLVLILGIFYAIRSKK